jgi:hypothetical protein
MYGLQPVDVSEWLTTVEWASSTRISFSMLKHVRARLEEGWGGVGLGEAVL